MISNFRKGADNIFVRILLGLIALSFIGIGGSTFINGNSTGDIVSFKDAKNISYEQFQFAKAKEIDLIQKQNGINLTEENIAELDINNSVLRKLINNSIIHYLADRYELDISDDKVISVVKKMPYFKNDRGEFDLSLFKATFDRSPKKEEEYIESVKDNLIASSILNIFLDSFTPPKIMTENIINYMAEKRIVDIVSVDLTSKAQDYKPEPISQEQIKDYYDKNKALFVTAESRSFQYIKADKKFIQRKITVSDSILKEYYEENIGEFNSKKFSEVKNQVKEEFLKEKTEEFVSELAGNFEEDVAGGLTLKEISEKYGLEIITVEDKTLAELSASENTDYVEIADSVFEIAKNELSYPVEVRDKHEILLTNVTDVKFAREQGFEEVQDKITTMIENENIIFHNLKSLEKLQKTYGQVANPSELNLKEKKILANQSFLRSDFGRQKNIPLTLFKAIFIADVSSNTRIVAEGNKAFFAHVKNIKFDKEAGENISKNSSEHYNNLIQEGVFQELIDNLAKRNRIKITEFGDERNKNSFD